MTRLQFHAAIVLFGFVMLGSFYLIYIQNIDGRLINKPLTFNTDTQNMMVEKAVYHRGEAVAIYFDFCKHRQYVAQTTWRLVNRMVLTFAPISGGTQPNECFHRWAQVGFIPDNASEGPHHLEGVSEIRLNPLNTIIINYRTVNFNVI